MFFKFKNQVMILSRFFLITVFSFLSLSVCAQEVKKEKSGFVRRVVPLLPKLIEVTLENYNRNEHLTQTELFISSINYTTLDSLSNALKKNKEQVKDVKKSMIEGVGVLKVVHKGTTEEFASYLSKKIEDKFQITELNQEERKISIKGFQ